MIATRLEIAGEHVNRIKRAIDIALFAFLAMAAYALAWKAGERGFFAFDQSIIFDGGYRILSGQTPYKDFLISHGPVVFFLQALLFRLAGVNYGAMVLGAAIMNALAALLSVHVVRTLFPTRKALSHVAGWLTAVWFYAPFGTVWVKQTSFFFALAALSFLLADLFSAKASSARLASCGFLISLAVLSKLDAGLLLFPLFPVLIFAASWPDWRAAAGRTGKLLLGCALAAAALLTWVWLACDWNKFWLCFYEMPSQIGGERIRYGGAARFLEALSMGFSGWDAIVPALVPAPVKRTPAWIRLLFLGSYLVCLLSLVRNLWAGGEGRGMEPGGRARARVAAVLCLYLIHFHYLFMFISLNHSLNGLPFLGLALALGACLWPRPAATCHPLVLKAFQATSLAGLSAAIAALSLFGMKTVMQRRVHPVFNEFPETVFSGRFREPGLKHLRWGEPTYIFQAWPREETTDFRAVSAEDVQGLCDYLRSQKSNFFVFPDFTIFYGLLGVPSPQPIVWFHRGLTYPWSYDPEIDQWVVSDLVKNDVRIAVLEARSHYGSEETLSHFPRLAAFLEANFRPGGQIGIFRIFVRKEA